MFEKAEEYFVRRWRATPGTSAGTRDSWGDVLRRDAGRRDGRRAEKDILRRVQGGPLQAPRDRARCRGGAAKGQVPAIVVSTKDVKAATKKWVKASYQFEGLVQLENCPGFLPIQGTTACSVLWYYTPRTPRKRL